MRQVRVLPGSNINICCFPQWLPIVHNESSHELWVDYWEYEIKPNDKPYQYTKQTLEQ